jgi:autotransporter-associated beta strand protein
MNKVFKVVWSKAVGQWVVTSEFGTAAAGRTRRTANRLTTGPLAALSLMTALALYGPSAMAAVDITNIGFETGTLSGWTYSKTGTQGSTSYGTTGVGAAVVTGMTDFEADNGSHTWTVTPFGNNMASLQAGAGSDSFTTAATALGLDAASRALVASTMAGSPTNASWLYQDLTLAAGDYFSMAWQYVSTDYEPFNDASLTSLVNLGDASVFATVNNQNAQYALLGATNLGTGSYSTGSYGATGWQVATYQVSTAGTYRLGFMSLNLQDTQLSPVLFVDQAPGLTFDKGVPFGPVAPNPGSGAPTTPTTPTTPTGPIVIDGPKGTDELGNEDEASFEGGTLVVDKDTNVDVDFKIDDKPGTIDQNGHESTFTGKIDDATNGVPGSLIVKNSGSGGSVTLTNTNGYTGTTEVDENATLALSGNGSIDKSKKLVIDGTLDVTQAAPVVNIISLDGKGDVALGNNTLSITDANDEFEGTIGGQGDVAIKGGTQVLSGNNTYAGGTSVSNNAVLQVSSDENLGDAAGKLTLGGGTLHTTGDVNSARDVVLAGNGTFDTDTNTTLTNSGDVSGNGGLIKNGEGGLELTGTVSHSGGTTVNEGELTLSGQNTYTGGTTLNGGVLNVSSDGNLGDAAGGLTFNGGTLQASSSMTTSRSMVLDSVGALRSSEGSTLTVNGPISGGGTLVADGQGTLVLGAANTHAGGTLISGGTVVLAHAGGLGSGAVAINDATLRTTVDTQVAQPLLVMGEATLDVASGTTTQLTGMLDGSRSTGCFIKSGAGRLNMAGTAVLANGTCVNEGTLSANGVLLSNVQVEREGTVRGTGTIAGNMRVDGTLAPGNSPGTLAVTGTVALTDDATLQIDIDGYGTGAGAGNYSRLLVSGAAGRFVANGTLQPLLRGISGNAGNTFTPKVGDMFRIVSGEGGVTGTFDRILQPTEGLAARTRFQVYYTTGFDIDLYVTPTAYSADLVGKVNGNGLATAAALDALVEASDAGTTTAEQTDLLRAVWQQDAVALPVLVTALTGESHAKLAALAQSNATALADDVTGRLGQGVLLDASSTRIDQLLWANIGYGDLSVDADASADRFDARQRRATAGIDVYRSSNVAWGAGLGRTTSELERSPLDNTLDSNAFFAYGAARAGAVVLDGMLSYSADRWESQRPDALGADGPLSGKASGTTRMASAGVSLPFTAAGLSWQPSLRGNWQKVERNAYREAGDSLAALDVARLQAEGSRATLGLSVGSLLNDPLAARGTWQFGLQAGINHGQARQATVTTALAGERVDLSAAEAGKAFGRAQLQGTVRLGASSYLYGGVSTEQGSGVENNSVNAGIRIAL